MPKLIKRDAIRLIEASIESLNLACFGLSIPKPNNYKSNNTIYAPEIGLIGVSAELAMSSVLVQSYGIQILKADENRYKTGAQILNDFRKLLNEAPPVIGFLTSEIDKPSEHRDLLLNKTIRFKLLITSRANSLHNGVGLSYETTATLLNEVSDFLVALGKSYNLKPYMINIPKIKGISHERHLIIEDLARLMHSETNIEEKQLLLTSLFLVLPEVPKELPEWLSAFERFSIAPKETDLKYLISVIETALPATLHRTSLSGESIPVRIETDNPFSIPISPQYLRNEFTKIPDQWYADAANANGRLNKNNLDLPPIESIVEAFALGLVESNILKQDALFTAQNSWPFIVSCLNINSGNTHGPIWFLIRNTNDLGQLKSLLKKAARFGAKALKENINQVILGIDAIIADTSIDSNIPFYKVIIDQKSINEGRLQNLTKYTSPEMKYYLGEEYNDTLASIADGEIYAGILLNTIIDSDLTIDFKKFWVKTLSEASGDIEDVQALLKALRIRDFSSSHTAVRKAIRLIDFLTYGPKID